MLDRVRTKEGSPVTGERAMELDARSTLRESESNGFRGLCACVGVAALG